ncbi:subunit of tubulin prefoldin [Blastocladiella emersonii ATCC 22665]|nr:subunit of tubulin prefoldin [Blastocladiella emersonii ATCC 22665]
MQRTPGNIPKETMTAQDRQVINLESIPLPQLQAIQQQLTEEIQHLTSSFTQLKQAQAKFADCLASLDAIQPANAGKQVLIPLTNSLYVNAKLADPDRVIVDVGTGYFVEKKVDDAVAFYGRKQAYIKANLEKLQETIVNKQQSLRTLQEFAQEKVLLAKQQQALQQANGGGAPSGADDE